MNNQRGSITKNCLNSASQSGSKTIKMNEELHNIKVDTVDKFKVPCCLVFTQSQTETMAVGKPSMDDAGTSMFCFPFVSS